MASETVSLSEAAELLGVHYMTAYRYVRTGRMPGQQVDGEWRVARSDVAGFRPGVRGKRGRAQKATDEFRQRFEDRLLAGDEAGAWRLTEDALTGGISPRDFYGKILTPSLQDIGSRWAAGEVSVAEEHTASAVAHRLVGRTGPFFARKGRRKGELILGAPAMDLHGLPVAMLSDVLRGEGFRVHDLGANVPAESFVGFADDLSGLTAVGVCATMSGNEDQISLLMAELAEAGIEERLLGGRAIESREQAEALGATHFGGSSDQAVACFLELADRSRAARR